MPDVKISAGADPVTLVSTDKVPMARSASTTAYAATMAELATYANGAYTPNYFAGTPSMDGTGAPGTAAFVSRGDHVHPTDTSRYAASNPSGYQTAAQVATAVAPAFNGTGRNLLHNPLFNVAQRGAGPFTTPAYTVDRWSSGRVTDTISYTRDPLGDAARTSIGDEAATYCLTNTFTGNAAAGSYNYGWQGIEDVRRLAGKTITVSFWGAGSGGATKFGVGLRQYFGTGGSPSALVSVSGQSVTLTASFVRYSFTFSVPSIVGKTLGTNNDHMTILAFWYSAGSTFAPDSGSVGVQSGAISIWGVQLEIGSVATPLEKPDPRYDLANCQRFYQSLGGIFHGGYGPGAAAQFWASIALPVTMRAAPTAVTFSGQTYANASGLTLDSATATTMAFHSATVAAGVAYATFNAAISADL